MQEVLIEITETLNSVSGYPEKLKQYDQWLLVDLSWNEESQKYNKRPVKVVNNALVGASKTNPSDWMSFDQALSHLNCGYGGAIGFCITEDDPFICIDLDKCINEPWCADALQYFDCASELSVSGNGAHIFIEAEKPKDMGTKNKDFYKSQVEILGNSCFVALTGSYNGKAVVKAQDKLNDFAAPLIKRKQPQLEIITPVKLSDDVIIKKASESKSGDKFKGLYFGTGISEDKSADDLSLCNLLAFWCNKDSFLMDKLFRQSARYRDKWDQCHSSDGLTYGQMTIDEAISGCTTTYTGKQTTPGKNNAREYTGIDYDSPLPDSRQTNSGAKPLKTALNLEVICERLGVIIRYNIIKKDVEILIPSMGFTQDNQANASLAWLKSECAKFNYSSNWVSDFTTLLAEQNRYNPVQQWIDSKPWDGNNRLYDLFSTIQSTTPEELKNALIKRWLLSAIEAVYSENGVSAQGILVFQGAQSLGKTSWFKRLAPKELDLIQDGVILRPDDRDSVKQAVSFWLVELGELDATFKKSDISALKAFITKDRDVLRLPYAPLDSKYSRRTVFFASVNPKEYLHDDTGNRRYWTIECTHIDYNHNIDMQQLWAEVKHLWLSGEKIYLSNDELMLLNDQNLDFTVGDHVEDQLLSKLDWSCSKDKWSFKTPTEILQIIGIEKPSAKERNKVKPTLKLKTTLDEKRTNKGRMVLCPPLVIK